MYQQPIARSLSTEEIYRCLNTFREDDRKLSLRDVLLTALEVCAIMAICWGLHAACA